MNNKTEFLPKKEWSKNDTEKFYKDLLSKALESIPESGAAIVLGPMFIIRPPEENFALFEKAQQDLIEKGIPVFNQLSYVDYIIGNAPFDYKVKFELFYKELIKSGKITAGYLLPDWEKSEGTRSEIEYCKSANIPVHQL